MVIFFAFIQISFLQGLDDFGSPNQALIGESKSTGSGTNSDIQNLSN